MNQKNEIHYKKKNIVKGYLQKIHIKKEALAMTIISTLLSISLFFFNSFYLKPLTEKLIYNIVNIIALIILIIPLSMLGYSHFKSSKELEEQYPDFLRAITEGLRGGMTLPIAIKYASRTSYGALDPYVKNLVAQVSWGVPFNDAMQNFATNTNSKAIERSTSAIIEAHSSGGDIATVLDAISQSFIEIDKLRKEREVKIGTQMVQGYIIYFVFIGIMIGMQKFLIPALSFTGVGAGADVVGSSQNPLAAVAEGRVFIHLATIQGFFSGLSVGKLAEGRLTAGLKHATLLGLFGYTIMSLFG